MRGDSNSLKHVRVDLADDIYKTGLFSCFWRRIRATIEERFANVDKTWSCTKIIEGHPQSINYFDNFTLLKDIYKTKILFNAFFAFRSASMEKNIEL